MKSLRVLVVVYACVWVLFLCGTCSGRFVVEKNNLKVTSPDALRGVYECAIGNFGVPQYGGTLIGTVVYPKSNQNACGNFDVSFKSSPGGLPIFLLADRGDCYFTLKAWNAQNAGASAILVTDNRVEPLITMDAPEEQDVRDDYLQKISIPSALISKSLGDDIKKALSDGRHMVNMNLDWRESLPHPDDRVEYELWTNSNDECGPKCDSQINFVKNFKGAAQILEKKGYAQFTPHYITWYCPEAFILSQQCKSQCINGGRYCAPDPEQDFSRGYTGRDVVLQNLRQACLHKVANESMGKPWIWWDYVTDFSIRCPMKGRKYNAQCANEVLRSLGVDIKKVDECMGDPDADVENQVLKGEQQNQVGKGSRGDVTILPTLIINNRQYRGKLDKSAVLKAICSAFKETTEPAICLTEGIETNECHENNGGCWHHKAANITACRDTFRGRVCECPMVQGVMFVGDGYTHCEASGALRCGINNGGCWKKTESGKTYSACIDDHSKGCKCPPGFRGDGVNSCQDIDECKGRLACQCSDCKCKNTWGSYDCNCGGNKLYIREHDVCLSKDSNTDVGWGFVWVIVLGLAAAGLGGYVVYKYRFQRYMDSEIRAIMAQYMPLDSNQEHNPSHNVQLGGV